jgi:type II secretory pathway predicted ATPase ExeA
LDTWVRVKPYECNNNECQSERWRKTGWFVHWDPSFDLARGGIELSFRIRDDMNQLLVRTEATMLADRIIDRVETLSLSPRYHIVGTRGFGKSTLLNYFAFRLFSELPSKGVLPVYSSLSGTAVDEKDLEFVFFKSLLEALFDVPSDLQRFQLEKEMLPASDQLVRAKLDYRKQLQDFRQVSLAYVSNALENQLDHLKKSFRKVAFLIDGLDKQKTDIVLKFLRNTQEHINNLVTKHNLMFIDSADPDWRETLGTKEFSGVRGVPINLRGWTPDEVQALVKNRLQGVGVFQMPFDRKALEVLVEDFQGNPREILQYCTTLLHFAATEHIGTIGSGLARKVIWKDTSKEKFCSFVISDPDAGYAFEKLQSIYSDRQMMNILLATYNQRAQRLSMNLDYEERSSVGITLADSDYRKFLDILLTRGCIRITKARNYVELDDDLRKLFAFVIDMNESLIALPVVLSTLEPKVENVVKIPKGEIAVKEEIQKIFEQHPNEWLSYKQCKEMLLDNPRTKDKLEEHFKDEYDKKITHTIPLIIHELLRNGKLMQDDESSSFRWKSHLIDSGTADFFKSKSILDLIESSKQAAVEGQMTKLSSMCEKLVQDSFARLNELLENRINTNNVVEASNFLQSMNVEVARPVSLNLFFQTLKEPICNIDEANVCLQTAILYARRIFTKINQLRRYEPMNQEIVDRLRKYRTGISKEREREYFRTSLLPILTENYGKLLDCMTAIKTGDGILERIPPELNDLLNKKQFLQAQVYRCPTCKKRTAVSATSKESIGMNYCVEDRVPYVDVGPAFILSEEAYRSWNVWMEEYAKSIFESLPCKHVETGIMVKPLGVEGIATSEEVDLVVVFNGRSIAVECMEYVSVNRERNDIADIIYKMQSVGLFHHIILLYKHAQDTHAFSAEIKKNERMITPVTVMNPKNLKSTFLQVLESIEKAESQEDAQNA